MRHRRKPSSFVIQSGERGDQPAPGPPASAALALDGVVVRSRRILQFSRSQPTMPTVTENQCELRDDQFMKEHIYFVYILTCASQRSLYIGVTNSLRARVAQHKRKAFEGFTSRYNIDRLVYFERFKWIHAAIAREKQLKGWSRAKKLALIRTMNPGFHDLSEELFRPRPAQVQTFGGANPLQDASTANPERPPGSPLSMTKLKS